MKIKIDLDDDTADSLVRDVLKMYIDIEQARVSEITALRRPKKYQLQDLKDSAGILESLKDVYEYFGGNIK
jgi:hypothetical protein